MKINDEFYYVDSFRCDLTKFKIVDIRNGRLLFCGDEGVHDVYMAPNDPMLFKLKSEALEMLIEILEDKIDVFKWEIKRLKNENN